MRLLYDTTAAIADYHNSPPWLKALLQAFSDGIHYYLYKHPETKPLLLTRFEPWYPLLFTDGAYISMQTGGLANGRYESLVWKELAVHSRNIATDAAPPTGSNAFALAPSRTADGTAMLVHQPACFVLLPHRNAHGERRGTECIWCSNLGTVLYLSGLQ
jgi:acyl-homoserine-lactone acylase